MRRRGGSGGWGGDGRRGEEVEEEGEREDGVEGQGEDRSEFFKKNTFCYLFPNTKYKMS